MGHRSTQHTKGHQMKATQLRPQQLVSRANSDKRPNGVVILVGPLPDGADCRVRWYVGGTRTVEANERSSDLKAHL